MDQVELLKWALKEMKDAHEDQIRYTQEGVTSMAQTSEGRFYAFLSMVRKLTGTELSPKRDL